MQICSQVYLVYLHLCKLNAKDIFLSLIRLLQEINWEQAVKFLFHKNICLKHNTYIHRSHFEGLSLKFQGQQNVNEQFVSNAFFRTDRQTLSAKAFIFTDAERVKLFPLQYRTNILLLLSAKNLKLCLFHNSADFNSVHKFDIY